MPFIYLNFGLRSYVYAYALMIARNSELMPAQAIHFGAAGDVGLMPLTSNSQQNSGSRRSPMTLSLSPTTPSSRSSFAPQGQHGEISPPGTGREGDSKVSPEASPPRACSTFSTALRSPASRPTTSRCPAALASALRCPTSRSTARRSPAARSTTPFARPLRWALHEATPAASPRRLPTPHSSAQSRRPHSSTRRSSRTSHPPGGMQHGSSARKSPAARSTTSRCTAALLSALR